MAVTLTARAEALLDNLDARLRNSEQEQRIMQAFANELERIETYTSDLRAASFPHTCNDEMGTLPIWEAQLGIPIKPAGLTEEERRNAVLARWRARHAEEGKDWVAAASEFIGPGWTHQENTPAANQITVSVPTTPDQLGRIELFLRPLTPAAEELILTTGAGFVVGESTVGEETI